MLRFTSGTVFTGAFLDGEFHGDGILEFPGCGRYIATWERGKVVKGNYVFADGLGYDDTTGGPWSYCAEGGDRRFYSEVVNGLRPAGDAQLANAHPPPKIPAGSYDVGHGYFVEGESKVYSYSRRRDAHRRRARGGVGGGQVPQGLTVSRVCVRRHAGPYNPLSLSKSAASRCCP